MIKKVMWKIYVVGALIISLGAAIWDARNLSEFLSSEKGKQEIHYAIFDKIVERHGEEAAWEWESGDQFFGGTENDVEGSYYFRPCLWFFGGIFIFVAIGQGLRNWFD